MKQFTKADLRNGDVVVRANGDVAIVCLETKTLICRESAFNRLDAINDDLTNAKDIVSRDIDRVYRPRAPQHCSFSHYKDGRLVYDRYAPIEMTHEEIEDKLGFKIRIVWEK